ncbi:emp24/gp25L/p24 family protein [archaeon]|nr:MAG: emp24/gp25L/p24 family protein [archaeon]
MSDSQRVVMDFDPPEQGTFAFCLDNRKAHFFPKYVQIDIRSSATSEDTLNFSKDIMKDMKASENIPELENTLNILQRIYKGVHHIRAQQDRDRYRLALHGKMNEQNYMHVFYGSIFETGIFIVVALFQVWGMGYGYGWGYVDAMAA